MNAGVRAGLVEDAIRIDVRRRRPQVQKPAAGGRRVEPRRQRRAKLAPRAVPRQPGRGAGPRGVRGPVVSGAVSRPGAGWAGYSQAHVRVERMVLTDRGLALAMLLIVSLVVAAVFCIATTAMRVTADPGSPVPVVAPR